MVYMNFSGIYNKSRKRGGGQPDVSRKSHHAAQSQGDDAGADRGGDRHIPAGIRQMGKWRNGTGHSKMRPSGRILPDQDG